MQSSIAITHSRWQTALRPTPRGEAIAAIGDVHGQAHLLEALHEAIADDLRDMSVNHATVIHLGDYIDRGPDSIRSLELARSGIAGTENIALIGNHEDLLLTVLRTGNPKACKKWLSLGGSAVLAELGISEDTRWVTSLRASLETDLVDWLEALPFLHRIGDLVFVHGGLKPGKPLAEQSKRECAWIWDEWIADPGPYVENVGVVHGHIPIDAVELDHPHKLDVDTRAHASGILTAVVLNEKRMRLVQAVGVAGK